MNISRLSPVFLFLVLIFFSNCDTADPPIPDNKKLTLKFEDASCTEVWFTLETENLQLPTDITILLNDSVPQYSRLNTQDSLLYIDSLLPNQTYTIQSFIHSTNQSDLSSNKVTFTTMDTTSHNFTFETFTFGEHSSSVLYDVAIIDENNIWVVGEIYMNDSLGQPDPQAYGVAIWDGQIWKLKKLLNNSIPVTPRGILALSQNDFYLAAGSIFHWDGVSSTVQLVYSRLNLPNPNGTIEKLWGNSSSTIYGVGNVGSIVFYNGSAWQSLESETDLNINGIWGDYNEEKNEWEVLAVGGNILQSTERIILKIKNTNQVQQINIEGTIEYPLSGVWFKSKLKYFISGDGFYTTTNLDKQWQNMNLPNYYGFSIKGMGLNDIVVCGGAGYIGHFNGYSWKNYLDGKLQEITGNYYSIAIKDNTITAVGNTAEGEAIIVIGKR